MYAKLLEDKLRMTTEEETYQDKEKSKKLENVIHGNGKGEGNDSDDDNDDAMHDILLFMHVYLSSLFIN